MWSCASSSPPPRRIASAGRRARDGPGLLRGHRPVRLVVVRDDPDAPSRRVQGAAPRADGGTREALLLGKNAPKGGPLIDTKTYACDGAAGSFYCKASYEPLPKGTYTWRITWVSIAEAGPKMPAHVELTVRW